MPKSISGSEIAPIEQTIAEMKAEGASERDILVMHRSEELKAKLAEVFYAAREAFAAEVGADLSLPIDFSQPDWRETPQAMWGSIAEYALEV